MLTRFEDKLGLFSLQCQKLSGDLVQVDNIYGAWGGDRNNNDVKGLLDGQMNMQGLEVHGSCAGQCD